MVTLRNCYLVKIAMVTSDSVHPNTLTIVYVDQDWNYLRVKIYSKYNNDRTC